MLFIWEQHTFSETHKLTKSSYKLTKQQSEALEQDFNLFEETKMNHINILLAKNENFKFVSCVFNINQEAKLQKTYTYKTLLDVKEGDLVVAPTQQGTFETIRIVEVGVDYQGAFDIKWIAAKLDTAHLDECKAMEEEIKQLFVEEQKRKKAELTKAQLEEYLGADGVSKAELIAKKVRI